MEHIGADTSELLKRRETEFLRLLGEVKDIYLGMHFCFDKLLIVNRKLDLVQVETTAEMLTAHTPCAEEEKDFYNELYCSIILYLYAECNVEDRIILSVLKIADTIFKEENDHLFDQTTFGIMLSDAREHSHKGNEKIAYNALILHQNKFEQLYNNSGSLINVYATVKKALNDFVDTNGFSCLMHDQIFQKAIYNLQIAKIDALYEMGLSSEWDA